MTSASELNHLTRKCLDAKLGGYRAWAVMSTGEKAAVALVLNRPDWLAKMGFTIVDAIDRAGPQWVPLLKIVAQYITYDAAVDQDLAPGAQLNERLWCEAGIADVGIRAEQNAAYRFAGEPPQELPAAGGRYVRVPSDGPGRTQIFGSFYQLELDPRSDD
jgi:hypothetical protein